MKKMICLLLIGVFGSVWAFNPNAKTTSGLRFNNEENKGVRTAETKTPVEENRELTEEEIKLFDDLYKGLDEMYASRGTNSIEATERVIADYERKVKSASGESRERYSKYVEIYSDHLVKEKERVEKKKSQQGIQRAGWFETAVDSAERLAYAAAVSAIATGLRDSHCYLAEELLVNSLYGNYYSEYKPYETGSLFSGSGASTLNAIYANNSKTGSGAFNSNLTLQSVFNGEADCFLALHSFQYLKTASKLYIRDYYDFRPSAEQPELTQGSIPYIANNICYYAQENGAIRGFVPVIEIPHNFANFASLNLFGNESVMVRVNGTTQVYKTASGNNFAYAETWGVASYSFPVESSYLSNSNTPIAPKANVNTTPIANGQIYTIKNGLSGLFMDVSATANATKVMQQHPNGGEPSQTFRAVYNSDGTYSFRPMRAQICWIESYDMNMMIYNNSNGDEVRFFIVPTAYGQYRIFPKQAWWWKRNRSMGVTNDSPQTITESVYSGAIRQHWYFIPQNYQTINHGGLYYINNISTNMVFDVYGNASKNKSAVVQYGFNGSANQKWQALQQSDGSYAFVPQHLSRTTYLESLSYKMVIYDNGVHDGKKFYLAPLSNGAFWIIPKRSPNSAITAVNASQGSQLEEKNLGIGYQQWQFVAA